MKRWQFGITPKLTLVFVLFAAAMLLALGIPAYASARDSLRAATFSELQTISIEKQAALDAWLADRQHTIGDIAKQAHLSETVAALLAAPSGALAVEPLRAELRNDLGNWAGQGHRYLSMAVIDATSGRVIAATDAAEEGKFREEQPYFVNGLQAAYVQNPYYDLSLQRPGMTAAAPILSPDGRVIAVLAGPLNMDEMNAIILLRSGLHQTDDAFLANTSNLLVTQPHLIPDPAVLQRGVHTEAVNRCLAHNTGVMATADYRHVPAFIAYRWIPARQLCLIVKIDQEEAFAPSRTLASTMGITGGLVLLIGSLVAFGMSRSITGPVRQLVQGAEQIGQGHLDYRIDIKSQDELSRLGQTFNQTAASLGQSQGRLEAANKELEAFSYSVSHDLRTPLRAIDGFSRILLEEYQAALPSEARRYLDLVRSNTQQMGNLVDDILAFSRLSRQPLKKQQVAPETVVRQALEELNAEQDGRQVEIVIGDLPACEADPALLKQVFVNLLANALKFTRARDVAHIEVGWEEKDGAGAYFVRDNGVGFDMRYVGKLFGVFQRLHRSEDYEGTGVGLAIVQRIVNRHGGKAWAEAEPDKGATFHFTLEGGTSND